MAIDGYLNFNTKVDSGGFNIGVKNIGSSLGRLRNSLFKVASAVGVAFSVAAVINFGKTCTNTATEVENAWVGLNSIINGQGKSFENAKKFVQEYVSDGLIPLNNAVTAYKNLSLRGYNEEQIKSVMNSLKNSATYARQSQYTLGDAVTTATEGLKNENSVLVDNAGVTKNVAKMWEDYAKSIGVSATNLTKEQKIQAEVNGIIEETKFQMGDASKYTNTYSGQLAKLSASFTNLKTKIGNILKVIVNGFLPTINIAVNAVEKLVDKVTMLFNSWGINTDVVDALSSATDIAIDGADNLTDSIDKTSEATQELKNQLASFDKLNVLKQEDESKNSTGIITTPMRISNINQSNQANTGLMITEKILDRIINKLKIIGSKLGFDDVNWSAIKGNINSIFKNLEPISQSAFKGVEKIAKLYMGTVGKMIGGFVKVTGKSLETVTGGVSKWLDENKEKISTGITEISDNIGKGVDNIGVFYDTVFKILGDSIDRMRPKAETAISSLLSGFSGFGLSIGTILSEAFNIATETLTAWVTNNQVTIGTFFDNIQNNFIGVSEMLSNAITDISNILTEWWSNSGAVIFGEICRAFTDIGTTFINVYTRWIYPVVSSIIGIFSDCWEYTLKPIFEQAVSFVGKIWECVSALWSNILSPIVNWLVNTLAPIVKFVLNIVRDVFETVFKAIGDVISGFLKTIGGVIDFITGVFKGDWKTAWRGIFTILDGVWQMIWGVIKAVVNLIIDGINTLVGGIYTVFSTIANIAGKAADVVGDTFRQDWGWELPSEPPQIPKLATGTVVPANYGEFTAILGDNKREPEIVSPLSTMKQALKEVIEEIGVCPNDNGDIVIVLELDGDVVFKKVVSRNNQYKKRHSGKSAFV